MSATDFFADDETWLQEQPDMNPYDEACGVLLRHLHVWVTRYTGKTCRQAVAPDHAACEPFRRRSWRCWRFHWQPDLAKKQAKAGPQQPPVRRLVQGTTVAVGLVRREDGANLVRDVILAEAVTQSDPRATELLQREYARAQQGIAAKTCPRWAEDAWSNVFGECCGPQGRLATYEGQRPLSVYLATVVTNEVYHLMKQEAREEERRRSYEQRKGTPPGEDGEGAVVDDPAEIASQLECDRLLGEVLQQALQQLAPPDRLLLYYRCVLGLTFEEVGRILGIHKGNVLKGVARAERKLSEAVAAVSRQRKQEQAVAECVEQAFRDQGCANFGELLARLLRETLETGGELQGGGTAA